MAGAGARDDLVGAGYSALASVAFGAVTVVGKVLTDEHLDVTSLLAIRFGTASLILFAILAARRQRLRPAAGEWWKLVALGVLGYGVEAAFFYSSLRFGTATATTLLFFTYPVVVAAASAALGRGMPGWLIGSALAAALAGVAIVVGSGGGLDITPFGILLAFCSSVLFSAYLLGAEAVLHDTPSLTGGAWVSGSAALGLAVAALVTGNAELPAHTEAWVRVLAMGAGTAVAFVALFAALRRLGAVRTSIVSAMEPVAAAGFAIGFLGEPLRAGIVIGGLLILSGAVAASVARGVALAEPPVP